MDLFGYTEDEITAISDMECREKAIELGSKRGVFHES